MRPKVAARHYLIDELKYFVYSTAVLSNVVFFSINSLLGIEYEGSEAGGEYIFFTIAICAIVCVFSLKDCRKARAKYGYFLPIIFSLIFVLEYSFSSSASESQLMVQSFKSFLAFAVSGTLVGTNLGNTKELVKIYPWIDLWALVVAVGCIIALPRLILSGDIEFGGSGYQQLSYSSALAFSIFLYSLLNRNKYRFRFLDNKLYSLITVFLMLGCAACSLASGGRGGFLLMAVNLFWMCFSKIKFLIKKTPVILCVVVLACFVLSYCNVPYFDDISNFRFQRIKNTFLTEGGMSVSNSGRDYMMAIDFIRANPFGYGFFKSYAVMGIYPHNIFLEIILDGGYLLLFFFILLLFGLFRKTLKIKKSIDMGLFFVILSYPAVMLMFTSTYLWSGAFWFCLAFILSYKNFKAYNSLKQI